MTPPSPRRVKRQPNGRCASCLATDSSVTVVMAKVHGAVLLCAQCRDYADAKGWLRS